MEITRHRDHVEIRGASRRDFAATQLVEVLAEIDPRQLAAFAIAHGGLVAAGHTADGRPTYTITPTPKETP